VFALELPITQRNFPRSFLEDQKTRYISAKFVDRPLTPQRRKLTMLGNTSHELVIKV